MDKRIIRRHAIDTRPVDPVRELADSSSFDAIDPALITALFETRYRDFLPVLLDAAVSQLAADKALQNLETALRAVDDDIRPATPDNHATIEAAHVQAFRYGVIKLALQSLVPADALHDTVLRFMEAQRPGTGSDISLRKTLAKLSEMIPQPAGAQPNPTPDGESPFGTLGVAPSRPTAQRRTPVRAKP